MKIKDFKPNLAQDNQKTIIIFHGLCKGCGICLEKCPFKAIKFSQRDLGVYSTPSVEFDLSLCNACGICEIACPDCAIKIIKKT